MNDREHAIYWQERGIVGKDLEEQIMRNLKKLPKTSTAKAYKYLWGSIISLIRARTYELKQDGADWASWAYLSLHAMPFAKEVAGGIPKIQPDEAPEE
jgi:hypothetical protein